MAKRAASPVPAATLTLPPDTVFKVQVVPPDKPPDAWERWRPYVVWAFRAILVISGLMWFFWLQPVEYPAPLTDPGLPELSITLTYPQYVSIGDEGTIDLSVTNVSTRTISGTLVLAFGDAPPVRVRDDSANVLKVENLPPGGKQTLSVHYSLALAPTLGGGYLEFTPRASIDGGGSVDYATQRVDVTFVPLVRTMLVIVLGPAGLAGLFWDQIKKRLFPSQ
ncbi:MAG TPA: hypothetical protein VIK33_11665 [Anaerolineae bacterium]